jgi:hypothetical protein
MAVTGFAVLHSYDFPCAEEASEKPVSYRLARFQARRCSTVTNVCHLPVELDEPGRRLMLLLDGKRTHEEIAGALSGSMGAPIGAIRRALPASLEWMARMGLLE